MFHVGSLNMQYPVIIASRTPSEAERIRAALNQAAIPAFHVSNDVLSRLNDADNATLISTSLLEDETALGIATKASIIAPTYTIIWACHAPKALNLLRLYGSGCFHVLGPNELDLLSPLMLTDETAEDFFNELVLPPFFIDEGVSTLKEPSKELARRLHVTFVGQQAMMSCMNAILHISASESLSLACVAPLSPWAKEQIIRNFSEYTLWTPIFDPLIAPASVTLCSDSNMLSALEPTTKHIVVCHGMITPREEEYLKFLAPGTRVFIAIAEGYTSRVGDSFDKTISPESFWDMLISTLYAND